MIRVLHVLGSLDRGGIETFLMNVYRKIDRTKVQFDFLIHTSRECAYNNEVLSLGGRIFSVPTRREGVFKNKRALNLFFESHPEYKIVHMHLSSLTYISPLVIAKKFNVPRRIVHSHNIRQGGVFIHKFIHKINQYFIPKIATDYFSCSKLAAKWLYGSNRFDSGNYKVIPNGIDIESFKYNKETREILRNELGLKQDQFVIGNIARFHPQKNHNFLLNVMRKVVDFLPDAVLLLVGDGKLRDDIERSIELLNLERNVLLLGVRDDISKILNTIDLFILPSLYEGLGIVLIEAQSNGLPVLASKDVIPEEVKILDNFLFIGLEESVTNWAQKIGDRRHSGRIEDAHPLIKEKGYDIYEIVKHLEAFYLENKQ